MIGQNSKLENQQFNALAQQIKEKVQIVEKDQSKTQQKQQEFGNEQPINIQDIKQPNDDQDEIFLQQNLQKFTVYKAQGTKLFKQNELSSAITSYKNALQYTNQSSNRSILFSNISICLIKIGDNEGGVKYCNKSLKNNPKNKKARINLGRCYEEINKLEQAYQEYKKVCEEFEKEGINNQDEKFTKNRILILKPKIDEINENKKKQVIDGLKNIGNSILGYFGMSLDNFKLQQGAGGGYNISFNQ